MRAKPFTFKKTRKVVTTFPAISIDLTVQEAADILAVVGALGGAGEVVTDVRGSLFSPLYHELRNFLLAVNNGVVPKSRVRIVGTELKQAQ